MYVKFVFAFRITMGPTYWWM